MWFTKRNLFKTALAAGASTLACPMYAGTIDYTDYMLYLINIEREKVGVDPVTLGTNSAAQAHADNLVNFCTLGHWGVDGTKPYMRYSLAGGYQFNQENVFSRGMCFSDLTNVRDKIGNVGVNIHRSMSGWMLSEGHKENILGEWHKKVNIGIAWDAYSTAIVQHFEDGHVAMPKVPTLTGGLLSLSGRVLRSDVLDGVHPYLLVSYDPPPHVLTLPQLLESKRYFMGRTIALLTYPGTKTGQGSLEFTLMPCGDPYMADADGTIPEDIVEQRAIRETAKQNIDNCEGETVRVTNTRVAQSSTTEWRVDTDGNFSITADISDLLSKYGSGVYTVEMLTAGEVCLLQHSLFYRTIKPEGYGS